MGPQGSKRKVTVMILTCQSWYLNAFSLNPNLKIVALQRDTVVPRGHLTMSRDTFGCHKWGHRDFLGSPVVRTSPSKCRGQGFHPGLGVKIPHVSWPKKTKHKQYRNKFNTDFLKTRVTGVMSI